MALLQAKTGVVCVGIATIILGWTIWTNHPSEHRSTLQVQNNSAWQKPQQHITMHHTRQDASPPGQTAENQERKQVKSCTDNGQPFFLRIIVLTYNRPQALSACLQYLAKAEYEGISSQKQLHF